VARFNRALLLIDMNRNEDAAQELRNSLQYEKDDSWRLEIRQRLQNLR
jgi:predicted negative regulator of RcsB-dependent stress response